jgi:hypothetical protein
MTLIHARRLARCSLLPAGLILLASCGGGGSDGGTGPSSDLSGTVTEATRATPVAGATVSVGSRQATTGADGRYELKGLSGGSVTLAVSAAGYEPFTQAVSVNAGANQRDVGLTVKTFYRFGAYGAYVPPFVENLRGILVVIGGFGVPSLPLLTGVDLFEGMIPLQAPLKPFADAQGFAVLVEDVDESVSPDGPAVVRPGLTGLAAAVAHHAELQHAPVLLLGISWGGCRAYEYAAAEGSSRVIGFITIKGGCHPETSQPGARPVPGYLFIGGEDTNLRRDNITRAFEANRPAGALWALAVEPGAGHTFPEPVSIMFDWMAAVVQLRLPVSVTPGQPVVLQPIAEADGWLGNLATFETCEFSCYAADPDAAAWLPSSATVTRWKNFVSAGGGGSGS